MVCQSVNLTLPCPLPAHSMRRSCSSNSFNARNEVTRRQLAKQIINTVAQLPRCFTFEADGHLALGFLERAPHAFAAT